MRVVGIIPARFSSSRFPGKPLINLKGKSMIQRVYEGVARSTKFDEVIVATDDLRIFDHVKGFGGIVSMTGEHETGTDRCAEVAKSINADVIVNIQGDEPLVNLDQLEPLVAAFNDPDVQIATLGIKSTNQNDAEDPNRIKIVLDANNNGMYFSRSKIPNASRNPEGKDFEFTRHIGVYAFRKDALEKVSKLEPTALERIESLEQLRWLYHGFKIRVVQTEIETPNIDVPEDIQKVLDFL